MLALTDAVFVVGLVFVTISARITRVVGEQLQDDDSLPYPALRSAVGFLAVPVSVIALLVGGFVYLTWWLVPIYVIGSLLGASFLAYPLLIRGLRAIHIAWADLKLSFDMLSVLACLCFFILASEELYNALAGLR